MLMFILIILAGMFVFLVYLIEKGLYEDEDERK